jgi:hypothetical protein
MTTANTTAPRKTSKVIMVNNTGEDLRTFGFDAYILAFIRFGTPLPEEMDDLFTVELYEAADGVRGIVNWA